MTAINPAQNPKVEHRIREFLKALNSGGGKAIEANPRRSTASLGGSSIIHLTRFASLRRQGEDDRPKNRCRSSLQPATLNRSNLQNHEHLLAGIRFWSTLLGLDPPLHDPLLSLSIEVFNFSTGWDRLLRSNQCAKHRAN